MPDDTQQLLYAAFRQQQAGNLAQAEAGYRQVLARNPRDPNALCGLGTIARAAGRMDAAIDLIRRAVAVASNAPALHRELAITLRGANRIEEAAECWRRLSQLQPDRPEGHAELGALLMLLKRLPEAIESIERAVAIEPASAILQSNLGSVLAMSARFKEAISALRRAVELDSNAPEPHHNLGLVLRQVGLLEEAEEQFREAVRLRPDHRTASSGLLFTLQYRWHDRTKVFAEHCDWEQRVAASVPRIASHLNEPSPDRRLRIGYVSPDFRLHSVSFFFESLIAAHDSRGVEVFCYSGTRRPDAFTARIQKHAHTWRDIGSLSDDDLAQIIHRDQIDILVDLAGHTGGDRLLTFAAKPSPIQVTYLGYPDTTGLSAMDYRITDAWADPTGDSDSFYVEKLIRLNRTAWSYRPPDEAPDAIPAPCLTSKAITFGCFNAMPKLSPEIAETWAQILRRVSSSRLFLKTKALQDSEVSRRLLGFFADRGIDPLRVELQGHTDSLADHLASYGRIDVALDSYPYHGTTTTCDALWMGVPVLTLAGDRHVSRVGVSLLNAVGHPELVASSADEYVELAVGLARERNRLTSLRAGLRTRMSESPLTDAASLAREIENGYRTIWREWCGQRNSV